MAYRKSYRRTHRKRTIPRKPHTITNAEAAWKLARSAWKGIKYLKTLVNSEKNKFDMQPYAAGTVLNVPSVSTTMALISKFGEGSDEGQRIGYSIFMNGLLLQYNIRNASASPPVCSVRVLLVIDTQCGPDVTTLALSDVLSDVSNTGCIESALNSQSVGRYKIIYNKVHNMNAVFHTQATVKKYIKLMHHVRYNGSTSTDIQKGGLYVAAFTDVVDASYTNPTCIMNIRQYYRDN